MTGPLGVEEGLLRVGDMVAAAVPLRQDGTYPDPTIPVGQVLVEVGTTGQVLDVGTYLQRHVVYAVMFGTGRVVGCLGPELVRLGGDDDPAPGPDAAAPAVPPRGEDAPGPSDPAVPVGSGPDLQEKP